MNRAESGAHEMWEAIIAPGTPNKEPIGYDLIFIDAYGAKNSSAHGARSITAREARTILDLCAKVRNITDMVILLAAPEQNDQFAVQAYEVGVDEYIPKPVSPLILSAKLRSWVRWTTAAFATSHS